MYRKRSRKAPTNLYLYDAELWGIFMYNVTYFGQLSFLNEYYTISFITIITKIIIFVSRNKTHFKISSFIQNLFHLFKLKKNRSYKFLPSCKCPIKTCKTFYQWFEKFESAIQRVHKLPHTCLSDQFQKVLLIKHERKTEYTYSSALKEMKTLQTKKKCVLHYQVWLLHLQKLSEYYVQILQQKCYFSTQILLHWESQTAVLYRPTQKTFREI